MTASRAQRGGARSLRIDQDALPRRAPNGCRRCGATMRATTTTATTTAPPCRRRESPAVLPMPMLRRLAPSILGFSEARRAGAQARRGLPAAKANKKENQKSNINQLKQINRSKPLPCRRECRRRAARAHRFRVHTTQAMPHGAGAGAGAGHADLGVLRRLPQNGSASTPLNGSASTPPAERECFDASWLPDQPSPPACLLVVGRPTLRLGAAPDNAMSGGLLASPARRRRSTSCG